MLRRADGIGAGGLIVLWVAMAACVGPIGDFPLNDDWIYGGSAKSVVLDGHFWIPGPAIPNIFAQAYWGALFCLPFGFSFTALRVSTLMLGLAGVLGLYALLRRLGGAPLLALLGAAALAVNPVYFNLANTFMTDVPFLSLTVLALLCLVRGLEGSAPAIWLGLGLALVAVLIRQTGLFLLLGFALAYPARHGLRPAVLLRGALPLLLGAALHFGFQRWVIATGRAPEVVLGDVRSLIPASMAAFTGISVRNTILTIPYLGVFVFPFVVLSAPVAPPWVTARRERLSRFGLLGAAGLFMALVVWKHDWMPELKNVMVFIGIGPLTLRDARRLHIDAAVLPVLEGLWYVVTAIGVAGAFLLLDRLGRGAMMAWVGWRSRAPAAWLYPLVLGAAAAYWAGILMLVYWDESLFDRYILYLLPFAMVAIMASQLPGMVLRPARVVLAVGCLLGYAAFSVAGTHDYIAWNRSRWQALDDLVEVSEVPPGRIDGGYEFNGWMQHDPRFPPRPERVYWWAHENRAYVVTFAPVAGYREIGRYPVARWLASTSPAVLVLRRADLGL